MMIMKNCLLILFFTPFLLNAQYGILDVSFGNQGVIHNTSVPSDILNAVYTSFDYDTSENIYITGYYDTDQTDDIGNPYQNALMVKYNSDGQLDSTFGEDGFLKFHLEGWTTSGKAIAVKEGYLYYLVYAGHKEFTDSSAYFWVKLDLHGNIDQSFGNQGWKQLEYLGMGEISKILKLENNELLIAGYTIDVSSPETTYLAKYDLNGDLISSFGINGQVVMQHGNSSIRLVDVSTYDDGRLFVMTKFGHTRFDLHLLDSSGVVIDQFDITQNEKPFYSMGIWGNKFYLSGSTESDNNYFLTKFNTTSMQLDFSFGGNGFVESDFGFSKEKPLITLVSNNKVYQIGSVGTNQHFGLTAHNHNGVKDVEFGTNGLITTSVESNLSHYPSHAMFYGLDRILVLNKTNLSMACYKIKNILKVEDLNTQSKFQLVPNPASNMLQISGLKGNQTEIKIFDTTGKLIQSFHHVSNNQTLDLNEIPKGVYIVHILSEKHTETKKLIVK